MNTLGNIAVNSLPQSSAVGQRQYHIEEWVQRLAKAIEENQSYAHDVESRFSAVIRSPPPTSPGNNAEPPQEYLVDHADRLRSFVIAIERSTGVLQSVISRAEL